jgi:hypothetical protein
MHPTWEYDPKDPVLSKYGVGVGRNKPNLAAIFDPENIASATNPGYTGEEQWNYMHDLMYGPRMDFMGDLDPEGPETWTAGYQLRDRGLIEPGMETYTPYAHDVIARSGLTSEMKKAIGFGVNPFEDTRAAGQWYAQQKYRKMSQAKKQAAMQKTIRKAEAAKQKAAADAKAKADAAAAAAKKQYSGQGAQGGGGGTNIGGGQQTSSGIAGGAISHGAAKAARGSMSGWGLADGGIVQLLRYGGMVDG